MLINIVVVNSGEDTGVSRLRAGDSAQEGGIGNLGGDEMQFTNLRSDSSYASHSTVVRVW